MKTVAIIQARLDSQRLPNKALEKIGDATVLAWVVYRTRKIKLDEIVVATTDRASDDPIVQECRYLDVECIRGSADDVLGRYYQTAKWCDATHILRVTADCPVLRPDVNQMILDKLVEHPELDYVSSMGWPEGVGQEAFTFDALEQTWAAAVDQQDREHVVLFMLRHLNCGLVGPVTTKMSVDTQEDLEFLRDLYASDPQIFDSAV